MARDTGFFDKIKTEVDLEDFLEKYLKVDLVPDGPHRMQATCPFHEEDTPSFSVTQARSGDWKQWHCFGACNRGGTVIDAALWYINKEITPTERPFDAVRWLNDEYDVGLDFSDTAFAEFYKTVEENENRAKDAQDALAKAEASRAKTAIAYLKRRGIDDEVAAYFKLGVDEKAGRLTIPLVDKANHTVSMDGRALFDEAPCKNCGEMVTAREVKKRYHQSRVAEKRGKDPVDWEACPHCGAGKVEAGISWLSRMDPKYNLPADFDKGKFLYHQFGATRALQADKTLNGLYLVEGYVDAWSGYQAGERAICSYNGAALTGWQARQVVEMANTAERPVILVPDTDSAGQQNVLKNVDLLRALDKTIEIQIVSGVEKLTYTKDGVVKSCKDLNDVLMFLGVEKVQEVLEDNRMPIEEWQVDLVLNATNERTGKPMFSKEGQMERVAMLLRDVRHKHALGQLVPKLARAWNISDSDADGWFKSEMSEEMQVSYAHIVKTVEEAQEEIKDFYLNSKTIETGFERIDDAIGGGARKGWLSMFLGKSGTGKTMLMTQILANMAQMGTRSIFFSLEQKAGQLFERMAAQALEENPRDIKTMILDDDPRLAEVRDLYKNLRIIDNVPEKGRKAIEMTPEKIEAIIRETNIIHFEGAPVDVVVIDHLGILKVSKEAPRAIQSDPLQAAGYNMEALFQVCKATDVFLMVLQQLPKDVKAGVEFAADAGRGGSAQTDYCDLIFVIWRPEQEADIEEATKIARQGQYKLKLGKNRYGPDVMEHLYFDKNCLRIMPVIEIAMPLDDVAEEPRVEVAGAEEKESAIHLDADSLTADSDVIDESELGSITPTATEKVSLAEPPEGKDIDQRSVAEELGIAMGEDLDGDGEVDLNWWES